MHTLTPPIDPSTLPCATDRMVTLVGGFSTREDQ